MASEIILTDKMEKIKSQFEIMAVTSGIPREEFNSIMYSFCCGITPQDINGDKHIVRTELNRLQLLFEDLITRAEDPDVGTKKLMSRNEIGTLWNCLKKLSKVLIKNIKKVSVSRRSATKQARNKGHLFSPTLQEALSIDYVKNEFEAEITSLNTKIDKMADIAKETESKNKKAIEDLKKAHKTEIDKLNAQIKSTEDEAKELENKHKAALETLENDYKKQIDDLNENSKKTAAQAVKESDERHKKEQEVIAKKHEAAVKELEKKYQDEINALNNKAEELAAAAKQAESQHEKALEDLKEEQKAQSDALNAQIKSMTDSAKEAETQHKAAMEDLEKSYEKKIDSKSEKLSAEYKEKQTAWKAQEKELQNNIAELKKVQEDYEAKIKNLEKKTTKPKKKKAPAKKTKAKAKKVVKEKA